MPGGKTHLLINTVAALPVLQNAAAYLDLYALLPFAAGYIFAALFCTPDLDLVASTPATDFRHVGHAPAIIWEAYWEEYAMVMHHRGFSHKPLLGTAGRWLYLLFPYAYLIPKEGKPCHGTLAHFAALVLPVALWLALYYAPFSLGGLGWTFLGFVVSDLVHETADFISTSLKRRFGHRREHN